MRRRAAGGPPRPRVRSAGSGGRNATGGLPGPLGDLRRAVLRPSVRAGHPVHDDAPRVDDARPSVRRASGARRSHAGSRPGRPITSSTSSAAASAVERHQVPPVRHAVEGELLVLLDRRRQVDDDDGSRSRAASSTDVHARSRTSGQSSARASPARTAHPAGPCWRHEANGSRHPSPASRAACATDGASSRSSSCAIDADHASPSTSTAERPRSRPLRRRGGPRRSCARARPARPRPRPSGRAGSPRVRPGRLHHLGDPRRTAEPVQQRRQLLGASLTGEVVRDADAFERRSRRPIPPRRR